MTIRITFRNSLVYKSASGNDKIAHPSVTCFQLNLLPLVTELRSDQLYLGYLVGNFSAPVGSGSPISGTQGKQFKTMEQVRGGMGKGGSRTGNWRPPSSIFQPSQARQVSSCPRSPGRPGRDTWSRAKDTWKPHQEPTSFLQGVSQSSGWSTFEY